jgi:hypothetical protein
VAVLVSMSQVKLLASFSFIIAGIIFVYWNSIAERIENSYQPLWLDFRVTKTLQSKNNSYVSDPKFRIHEIFKDRNEQMRKVCSEEYSISPKPVKINKFIWSIEEKHKLLMCRTAKHGSTTWASIFVKMYTKG